MDTKVAAIIDQCALDFHRTQDRKYFERFAKYAQPIIKMHVMHTCAGSTKWDADELFSILFADMWRLFKVYIPAEDKKFHWLMIRQLKNKTINYIQNITGRVYKICFVCNTPQPGTGDICCKCGALLKKPHAATGVDFYDATYSHTPDYLKQIADRELINVLLRRVKKDDPVTYEILTMFLAGHTKSEISRKVSIAQNALNNRIRKCERILLTMM